MYDLSQLEEWRRRAAAQDAAAAKAAREAAAAAEKAAAEKAAADEASRLDALYDALPPAERDSIDAMAMDRCSPSAREYMTPDTIRHLRREVVAEMYPAGTQTDDRHLSDPSPDEPPADRGQEARGKVRALVAGIGAQLGVRSPTRPRGEARESVEARERAQREKLARQAKVLGVR